MLLNYKQKKINYLTKYFNEESNSKNVDVLKYQILLQLFWGKKVSLIKHVL